MRQSDEASPATPASRIVLGRIVGFHGVRGWVKVHSDTEPRENILDYSNWQLVRQGRRSTVRPLEGGRSGKSLIARISGVDDREQAAALIGSDIVVERHELPRPAPGEYYWADLVGCTVVDVSGTRFGLVLRLFETGANDVMVVSDERGPRGDGRASAGESGLAGNHDRRNAVASGAEILVPWIRPDVIVSIDLEARQIEVDWDPDY